MDPLPVDGLKKFITEKEVEEDQRKGVKRRPDPPEIDNRTLYDKLQENKMKAEEEFKEMTKFSNYSSTMLNF